MTTEYRDDDRLDDAIAAQHRAENAVCVCGHEISKHHSTLGACLVTIGATYCHCLRYQQVQR